MRTWHLLLVLACTSATASAAQQRADSARALEAARQLADDEANWPQAASAFASLLQRSPGYAQAWVDRATFEIERDSTAAAERWLARALAVRPSFVPALVARGDLARRTDVARARADFLAAVAADSASAVALERVGRSYRWQNDCASALPWFTRAWRRDPAWDVAQMQIEGCTTPRQRADLLARLIAESPSIPAYEWRFRLPDSVVSYESRLRDFDGLFRLVPLAPTTRALVPRLNRARLLLTRGGSGAAAAAAADTVFALVAAQRDSLGRNGRTIMASALLVRAEGRAVPPRYREAIADIELAKRLVDARTLAGLRPNVEQILTGYRVEAVYHEQDEASLRVLTGTLLDTIQYQRLGARSASGASRRRLEQLVAFGRERRDQRLPLGYFLLLAAHAEPLGARAELRTALAGGSEALGRTDLARVAGYGEFLGEIMGRVLVQDLGLRTGTTVFCSRSQGGNQAFFVASYEDRLTKRPPLVMWSEVQPDGRGAWGNWLYDPAARTLRVQRTSGAEESWRVETGRLRSGSRELLPCRYRPEE